MRIGRACPLLALLLVAAAEGCFGRPQPAGEEAATRKLELARKLLARQRLETAEVASWADRSLTEGAELLFGPRAGELRLGPQDGPAVVAAGIHAAQVAVEARFRNPPGHSWSYGLGIRDAQGRDVRLYVNSTAVWALDFAAGDGPPQPGPSGRAATMSLAPGAANTLRLVAHGAGALLFINGTYAALLALPTPAAAGDVYLGSGFVEGDDEEPVRYEDWRVWRLR